MKRIVTGIMAHVDSGKTTFCEALLYHSGEIHTPGRVDHKNAFLDTHHIERQRGITIFSKQAVIHLPECELTLLDTPGHVDFSAETERTLCVTDCAVLIISASDGVQSHTETLWGLLAQYDMPVFIFVNKTDLAGFDRVGVMAELKAKLGDCCVDFEGDFAEEAAVCSDTLMEEFLSKGALSDAEIKKAVSQRKIFPCYFGSALRLKGTKEFLEGFMRYSPEAGADSEFGAKVFKTSTDENGAKLTFMKITGGSLRVRTPLRYHGDGHSEKVNQIRIYSGGNFDNVSEACAGEVCAVTGLSKAVPGTGFGIENNFSGSVIEPVLSYRVDFPPGTDMREALKNFRTLEEEEPQFHVSWDERLSALHVRIMGEIQLEVLKQIVKERFGLEVNFSSGEIIYKETIAAPSEGVGHYEPLRHYAEVHLLLEPADRGSGLHFASDVSEDVLDRNRQRLILTHLAEKVHVGVLTGSPITDMKITLVAGRAHKKHTEGGDFRQATYRAVRQGLMSAQSVLLEPWYDLRLELPQDCVGRAMNDIQQMGGSFTPPETLSDCVLLLGSAPVAAARHYAREVTAYTRGRGRLTCTLRGYAPCRDQEAVVAASGYDPERDLGNPADSIFCAHGAGFTVKWNEVNRYMHLHPEQADRADAAQDTPSASSRSGYRGTAAEDEELQAIFERTYGSAKPSTMRQPPRTSQPTVNNRPIPMQQDGPEYLLVDGYNIIFAWEELKAVSRESLAHARQCLMDILANYHGFHPCELILVFDAYKVAGNVGATEEYHGIHIVYTREAETADNYIEKTIYKIAKDHRVRVATSDALEQMIILGSGALRVSAAELHTQVQAAKVEIDAILRRNNARPDGASSVGAAMRRAMEKDDQA